MCNETIGRWLERMSQKTSQKRNAIALELDERTQEGGPEGGVVCIKVIRRLLEWKAPQKRDAIGVELDERAVVRKSPAHGAEGGVVHSQLIGRWRRSHPPTVTCPWSGRRGRVQRGDWKMRVTEVAEGVAEASFRVGARHARR